MSKPARTSPKGAIRHVERYQCRCLPSADDIDDPLTELAREGARRMLAQVLIAEADAFVAWWKDFEVSGWSRPHRAARPWAGTHDPTGVGPVEVRRAKVRDLSARRYVYVWADGVYCRPEWKTTPNAYWC